MGSGCTWRGIGQSLNRDWTETGFVSNYCPTNHSTPAPKEGIRSRDGAEEAAAWKRRRERRSSLSNVPSETDRNFLATIALARSAPSLARSGPCATAARDGRGRRSLARLFRGTARARAAHEYSPKEKPDDLVVALWWPSSDFTSPLLSRPQHHHHHHHLPLLLNKRFGTLPPLSGLKR